MAPFLTPEPMRNNSVLRFILITVSLGMIFAHATLFWDVREELAGGSSDFRIFYTAALMLRRGQGHSLYDDALQEQTQREFAARGISHGGPLPYNHPPFEAALFVPFTYFPYLPAFLCWSLLNCVVLLIAGFRIRSCLPHIVKISPWLPILAPFTFFPIVYAFMQGQDSMLLFLVYYLVYDHLRRGKEMTAGLLLGLGLFKYHLILPFVFILLLQRRWRALAGVSVTAALEVFVSWILVGGHELLQYPRYALQVNRQHAINVIVPESMPNLRGLLTGWHGLNPVPGWLQALLLLLSLALVFWASVRWRNSEPSDRGRWDAGFSLALTATFLVGYHSYNQDMSFLFLPVLLTLDHALARFSGYGPSSIITVGMMFLTPAYVYLTFHLQHENLFAIVILVFAGCLWVAAGAEPPASAGKSTVLSSARLG